MKLIDIDSWKRKEHFEFFSKMTSPYLGIVTEVECTKEYQRSVETRTSFFANYLHKSMVAVNQVPEFKYRIIDDLVYEFEMIHAGATIAREDDTFAFIFVPFSQSFEQFNIELQKEIKEVKCSSGLRLNDDDIKKNLIRHSILPWISFTSLLHPTNFDSKESVPIITFGKVMKKDNKLFLPISVEAHHGLVDGRHIAKYLEIFQRLLNQ